MSYVFSKVIDLPTIAIVVALKGDSETITIKKSDNYCDSNSRRVITIWEAI